MRKIVRDRILHKFNHQCNECGSDYKLEIDHIIPLSRGGSHSEFNFQVLCRPCNRSKGNKIDTDKYFDITNNPDAILLRDDFPLWSFNPIEFKSIFDHYFNKHAEFWNLNESGD